MSNRTDKSIDNYYDLLGVSVTSSTDQITAEYRSRAILWHPDKCGHPDALRRFQKLQIAKEVLLDANQRKLYDKWMSSGLNISFDEWKHYKDRVGMTMHWMDKRTHELALEEASHDGVSNICDVIDDWRNGNLYCSDTLRKFRSYNI